MIKRLSCQLTALLLCPMTYRSSKVITSGAFVLEAVQALNKAQEESDAVLLALAPKPLPPDKQGEEGEEGISLLVVAGAAATAGTGPVATGAAAAGDGAGATPSGVAADLNPLAQSQSLASQLMASTVRHIPTEAERLVMAFMSGTAAEVALASCAWGMQLIEPITDPGSLPKPPMPPVPGTEAAVEGAAENEDAPTVDRMLSVMDELPHMLRACEEAMRMAGTHPSMKKVEDSVNDFLNITTDSARRRAEDFVGDGVSGGRMVTDGEYASAAVEAAAAALKGAERAMDAAPLIMPPLQAERKLREAEELLREMEGLRNKAVARGGGSATERRDIKTAAAATGEEGGAEEATAPLLPGCMLNLQVPTTRYYL